MKRRKMTSIQPGARRWEVAVLAAAALTLAQVLLSPDADARLMRPPRTENPDVRGPASTRAPQPDTSAVTIIQLDPDASVDDFETEGYKVIRYDEFHQRDPWTSPDPDLRDKIFREAGVAPAVKGWDHLDRDMLFLSAQEVTAKEIVAHFKTLKLAQVENLQKVIRKQKPVKVGRRGGR